MVTLAGLNAWHGCHTQQLSSRSEQRINGRTHCQNKRRSKNGADPKPTNREDVSEKKLYYLILCKTYITFFHKYASS